MYTKPILVLALLGLILALSGCASDTTMRLPWGTIQHKNDRPGVVSPCPSPVPETKASRAPAAVNPGAAQEAPQAAPFPPAAPPPTSAPPSSPEPVSGLLGLPRPPPPPSVEVTGAPWPPAVACLAGG